MLELTVRAYDLVAHAQSLPRHVPAWREGAAWIDWDSGDRNHKDLRQLSTSAKLIAEMSFSRP
jgi:hypothetical protein